MKKVVVLFSLLFLVACGGGDSESTPEQTSTDNNIDIELKAYVYNDPLHGENPTYKINTSDISHFGDIDFTEWVIVSTQIENKSDIDLENITFIGEIENDLALTNESWVCMQCFTGDGSSSCGGIWEIQGGTIKDPHPTPDFPACEGEWMTVGACIDTFPEYLDCNNPTWQIDYNMPGSGFQETGHMTIANFPAGSIKESHSGSKVGESRASNVRDNHLARFIVKDSEGNVLTKKEYLFNVVSSIP